MPGFIIMPGLKSAASSPFIRPLISGHQNFKLRGLFFKGVLSGLKLMLGEFVGSDAIGMPG